MERNRRTILKGALSLLPAALKAQDRDDGYRGIWYFNQPSNDEYVYKYSGGFATYPQQHAPIAIYSDRVKKTFFCYGGTVKGKHELLHMVSYFDHRTGQVPRPVILLNKHTDDAHDNPTISIDTEGYIWIFSSSHGVTRPSFIHRSTKPWLIDSFDKVLETNFSYTQPWYLPGRGFLFLHTHYRAITPSSNEMGRALYSMASKDGHQWSEPQELSFAMQGHYQISWPDHAHGKLGTAFDIHPQPLRLNGRTNLYYMETADCGLTWRTVDGKPVTFPITTEENLTLVRNYRQEKKLVYLKDIQYDPSGYPIIVYLTSGGYESGPANSPRLLTIARWTGQDWKYMEMGETDHNYDHGSLYLENGGKLWRFLAATGPGPQPWSTGGEVEDWRSDNGGISWSRRPLTRNSRTNHTYVRRPLNAHPDSYAFWADGNPLKPSDSFLYFANRNGQVFKLPPLMNSSSARPEAVV